LNLRFVVGTLILCVFCAGCGTSASPQSTALALPTAFVARPSAGPSRVVPSPWAPPSTPARAKVALTATPAPATGERLATPAPGTTSAPATAEPLATSAPIATADAASDPALLEALLVVEINRVRDANGLPPYHHSPELSTAARAHSCDLATHATISHTSSDGRTLADRLAGSNPPWEWPSESIAAGFGEPAAIVALWMDEPPEGWHRRNILDTDQREVGTGYCYTAEDPSGNHHYWTADFSRRANSP
jgi:uncharacterized protein YkwD